MAAAVVVAAAAAAAAAAVAAAAVAAVAVSCAAPLAQEQGYNWASRGARAVFKRWGKCCWVQMCLIACQGGSQHKVATKLLRVALPRT